MEKPMSGFIWVGELVRGWVEGKDSGMSRVSVIEIHNMQV
jgi:hypothetical protein